MTGKGQLFVSIATGLWHSLLEEQPVSHQIQFIVKRELWERQNEQPQDSLVQS